MSDAFQDQPVGDTESQKEDTTCNLVAPLGSATSGRLLVASDAAGITLTADAARSGLCRAHFEAPVPVVRVDKGLVTVRYRRPLPDWVSNRRQPLAEIALNPSIPWDLEFRGHIFLLTADLRHLPLRALDLIRVSRAVIGLPRPVGAAYIYIVGNASDIVFHRPPGVAARVRIGNSASNITLDAQHFTASADGICWQTPGYNSAIVRYDISIVGRASNVTLAAG